MVVQMSLADLLLQFLLPYKALQILKWINVTFVPVFSKNLMTEILCNFWKEPPCTIQLRLGTICETNVRCLVAVCYFLAGSTPQSRFLRLHHPSMVFPKFTLDEYKCSFCLQEASFFFDSIGFISSQILKWPIPVSFDVSFLFDLKFEFLSRCWTWNWRGDFWVSVFVFFFIHILTSMNRALIGMWRLTIRVRVTLFFSSQRGHQLVCIAENGT